MERVLAALDFSPIGAAVLAHAADLAVALGAEVDLLHVAAPNPEFVGYEAGPATVRDARAHELQAEHTQLLAHAEALRARGLTVHARLVQGYTVDTILSEAERLGVGLIVVGAHHRGPLGRALLGSVSAGVLRKAKCPVLVVPKAAQAG